MSERIPDELLAGIIKHQPDNTLNIALDLRDARAQRRAYDKEARDLRGVLDKERARVKELEDQARELEQCVKVATQWADADQIEMFAYRDKYNALRDAVEELRGIPHAANLIAVLDGLTEGGGDATPPHNCEWADKLALLEQQHGAFRVAGNNLAKCLTRALADIEDWGCTHKDEDAALQAWKELFEGGGVGGESPSVSATDRPALDCPACCGGGQIWEYVETLDDGGVQVCLNCNGTGKEPNDRET